jgi:two-component system LytT family response regulator
MKVLIVEDEHASQQYLGNFLRQNFPALQLAGIADNVPEAINLLRQYEPDILFLDIEIKIGTGFDVLKAVPGMKAEVIFTTAFNQYAINAFEVHAIDFLLKPVEDGRLTDALTHCIERIRAKTSYQQITALLEQLQQAAPAVKRISIPTAEGIEFIDVDHILYAMAKGNYTELKLKTGVKITVSRKLKEIEDSLPANLFFRIHNSYLVQSACIKKYYRGRGGSIVLTDNTTLPVSATRRDELMKHFGVQ